MFYTILATYLFVAIIVLGAIVAFAYRGVTIADFKRELRSRSFWLASIVTVLLWPTIVCSVVYLVLVKKFNKSKERG